MSDKISQLVMNNALWIDKAVSALGIPGEFTPILWQNTNDMPPVFPNADTLGGTKAEKFSAIKALLNARKGRVVAIKDSWANLDLTPLGFEELFVAQWLYRETNSQIEITSTLDVERVKTSAELIDFALACNGEDIPPSVYSPELLDQPDVVWLVGKKDGQLVAGVTAVNANGLNGINNLFGETDEQKTELLHAAIKTFPDIPACGYEGDDAIEPYLPLGFETCGKLRVWLHLPE